MKKIFALVLALSNAACAILPDKEPQAISGDKATVRFTAGRLGDGGFHIYPRSVSIHVFSGKEGCPWTDGNDLKAAYLFNIDFSYGDYTKVVDVPVDSDIYAEVIDSYAGSSCRQAFKFTPSSGSSYVVNISVHDSAVARCSSFVSKADGLNFESVAGVKYATPGFMKGIFESKQICE